MTYSLDLRERVLSFIQNGGSQIEACRLFNIDRKTIYNWLNRASLSPSPAKTRNRLLDKEAVAAHVKAFPDALLRERASHFGVSVSGMWRCLKRMSIVKKNSADISN